MPATGADPIRLPVLDTSAYSRMGAGHDRVLDILAAAEIIAVPVIVLGELEAGFELGRKPQENRALLAEFLAELFVQVLAPTPRVAQRYGQIFARLRRAGTPIPLNDVWIAATAIDCGGSLVTFDRHFERVDGLDAVILGP